MTHRETCFELRRIGNLLASGAITMHAWHTAVLRTMADWKRGTASQPPVSPKP